MNIYDVIVEGFVKSFNKKRKNAITDKLGKAVKSEDYNMAGSPRGNRSVGRAVLSFPESPTAKAAVRKVRNRGLPESLYTEVYDIICEGLVKAANKAKKNAYMSNEGRGLKKHIQSLKGHKETKKEVGTSNDLKAGRRLNRSTENLKGPHFWSNSAATSRKAGFRTGARERLATAKRYRDQDKPKLPESLAYEIYDIICEGLVKAVNKAKKNAYMANKGKDKLSKIMIGGFTGGDTNLQAGRSNVEGQRDTYPERQHKHKLRRSIKTKGK